MQAKINRDAGRPLTLTEDIIRMVGETLPRCMLQETCIAMLGISRKCWWDWVRRGRRAISRVQNNGGDLTPAEELYAKLVETIQTATAEKQAKLLAMVEAQAEKNWQAAMALLNVMAPEKYGSHKREIAEMAKRQKELQARLEQLQTRQPRITAIEAEIVKPNGVNGVNNGNGHANGNGHKANGVNGNGAGH